MNMFIKEPVAIVRIEGAGGNGILSSSILGQSPDPAFPFMSFHPQDGSSVNYWNEVPVPSYHLRTPKL
ncbi:hypothetical protein [Bacillus sp. AK128]